MNSKVVAIIVAVLSCVNAGKCTAVSWRVYVDSVWKLNELIKPVSMAPSCFQPSPVCVNCEKIIIIAPSHELFRVGQKLTIIIKNKVWLSVSFSRQNEAFGACTINVNGDLGENKKRI